MAQSVTALTPKQKVAGSIPFEAFVLEFAYYCFKCLIIDFILFLIKV